MVTGAAAAGPRPGPERRDTWPYYLRGGRRSALTARGRPAPVQPLPRGREVTPPPAGAAAPAASRRGGIARGGIRWMAASLLCHGGLVLSWSWWNGPEPVPDALAPIALLDVRIEAPDEATPPPPDAPVVSFGRSRPPRIRERVVVPRESFALVPPPPRVALDARGGGGGISIEATAAPSLGGFSLGGVGGGTAGAGRGHGNAIGTEGSFEAYVAGLREAGLDVIFVIDATGSMGPVIEEVRVRLHDLARTIRRLVPLTRYGVVAYRDHDDEEFATRVAPLTLSAAKVRRFLDALEAKGGGDLPEAVDAGLEVAIEGAAWRAGARRVVIVVGDAPPRPERLSAAVARAASFHRDGGVVAALDVSIEANPQLWEERTGRSAEGLTTIQFRGPLEAFQRIAEAGGGECTSLRGERRLIRQLAVLMFGSEWGEQIRPLLADL